jgi:hypothetical protein
MAHTAAGRPTPEQGTAAPRARRLHSRQPASLDDLGLLDRRPSPIDPPLRLVFRTSEGRIGHTRCGQPLDFHGCRAGIELDFYCAACVEHVTLPECVLSRIPLARQSALEPARA